MSYTQARTGYLVSGNANDTRFLYADRVAGQSQTFTEAQSLGAGSVGSRAGEFFADTAGNVFFVPQGTASFGGGTVSAPGMSNSTPTTYDADGSDTVTGTTASNVLFGGTTHVPTGTGNDTISASSGDDTVFGGDGSDSLSGGDGVDVVFGGTGDDVVNGGTGNDSLYGGDGTDILDYNGTSGVRVNLGTGTASSTSEGNDTVLAFEGVDGTASADTIWGAQTDDTIAGQGGNDFLSARAGDDTISGGAGADTIYGGAGNDSVGGDADNDTLYGRSGQDTIAGGAGSDTANGGDGNDVVYGGVASSNDADTGADSLMGGSGMDTVHGGGGNDALFGGGESDTVYGGAGNDVIQGDGFTAPGAPSNQTLDWGNFVSTGSTGGTAVANGESLATAASANGATNQVTLEYSNAANGGPTGGSTLTYDSSSPQFGSADNSAARLYQSGSGRPDQFAMNFATTNDSFQSAVRDVNFSINDLDAATGFTDVVTLRAYDGEGNEVEITYTFNGETVTSADGVTLTGTAPGATTTPASEVGSAQIQIDGPVSRIEMTYANGVPNGTTEHAIWVSDVTYTTVAATAGNDMLEGGSGADSIDGQLGNDTLIGGVNGDAADGADTLNGGAGDDSLAGGAGGDRLFGGTGGDTLNGGIGGDYLDGGIGMDYADYSESDAAVRVNLAANTVTGGHATGDTITGVDGIYGSRFDDTLLGTDVFGTGADAFTDVMYGAAGNDSIEGRGGNDSLYGGEGNDTIHGDRPTGAYSGADNDVIDGGTGTDLLYGGGGNDTITGGAEADTIYGGAGADTLIGGTGVDSVFGGDGNDRVVFGRGDVIAGGAGANTYVIDNALDNTNATPDAADTTKDADITITGTNGDEIDLSSVSGWRNTPSTTTPGEGFITLSDGTRINYTFSGANGEAGQPPLVICFTPGTMIRTLAGPRAIETLSIGDMVLTRDNGMQPIRWIGRSTVAGTDTLAPIRIRKGAVPDLTADLLVSPQHRMLVEGYRAQLLFGEREVLVSAKHMLDGKFVTVEETASVTYIHMLFDAHEVVFANGAATESYHPASFGLGGVSEEAREELFRVFPELRAMPDAYGRTARRVLKGFEAHAMAW